MSTERRRARPLISVLQAVGLGGRRSLLLLSGSSLLPCVTFILQKRLLSPVFIRLLGLDEAVAMAADLGLMINSILWSQKNVRFTENTSSAGHPTPTETTPTFLHVIVTRLLFLHA